MRDFRKMLERTGQSGELISKARESLASLARLLAFVQQSTVADAAGSAHALRTLSQGRGGHERPRQLPRHRTCPSSSMPRWA